MYIFLFFFFHAILTSYPNLSDTNPPRVYQVMILVHIFMPRFFVVVMIWFKTFVVFLRTNP